MKKYFLVLSFLFAILMNAQNIIGSWQGELEFSGQTLPLIINLSGTSENPTATMDSPKQGAKGIPIEKASFINNQLNLNSEKLHITFVGTYKDNKISGKFMQNGLSFDMTLTPYSGNESSVLVRPQTPKPPFDYPTENISFKNQKDGNTLAGTISLPKDKKNFPIVILITGSGAQNRDEEIAGHKPFAVIADDFAKKGIATLRLDDRGMGESSVGSRNDTSENFTGDIDAAVDFLSKRGYKNIGLLGHSEGGMIAPMVAVKNPNVKFIISLAGPGVAINQLMYRQNEDILKHAGLPEDVVKKDLEQKKAIFNYIADYKGKNIAVDFSNFLTKNFPNLNPQEKSAYSQLTEPWMTYFLQYKPADNWSKIKIPVLALNGSLDSQVAAKPNLEAIKMALTKAGNKNFKTEEIAGVNHLFQTATTGSPDEYGEITETISPKVLDIASSWILGLKN
ncbi:alpha/beta fold hydrolase [Soonwooa sp.]|uniref:alpha/beta hydrolase family protein n=1 Tax=Soonwooa sp. TaxID=1938592 RepID=UPI00262B0E4D|nr:alpha/beta fold hydrolase [Soonwooa sp.]